MGRLSGIRFARKAVTFRRWILRHRGRSNVLRFKGFRRRLTLGFDPKGGRGTNAVPKGHLVLRVGQPGSEKCRVVVPVVYINHPLFRELLDRVESIYGYNHLGAIEFPCSVSEFEAVQRSVAASENPGLADLEHEKKKRIFSEPYLRNSFSKILVHSISVF